MLDMYDNEEITERLKSYIEYYDIHPKNVAVMYPVVFITLGDDWAENISTLNKAMDEQGYSFRSISHDRENNIVARYENLWLVY